ncbi:MAG: protein phosphatase 2C family protein [Paenibacillus sp.]|nr:protein phosphatase 2C family protein [Paenibacillus sp.]
MYIYIYIYILTLFFFLCKKKGANVAKYSSEKLPENVIDSADFKKGDFESSLRKGFLKIDSDLREGDDETEKLNRIMCLCINFKKILDPTYANEASGCTAIVALLTKDNVLYVVSFFFFFFFFCKTWFIVYNIYSDTCNNQRVMLVILVLLYVLLVLPNLYLMIINRVTLKKLKELLKLEDT